MLKSFLQNKKEKMIYEDYLFTPFLFEEKQTLSLVNILQIIGLQVFFFILCLILFSGIISFLFLTDPTLKVIALENYIKIFSVS